jgi:hypothetical protein
VYEYLTKSMAIYLKIFYMFVKFCFLGIHPSNHQQTLRRGMSIALTQNEKPAPPIRRTPSMQTTTQHVNNGCVKIRLKCAQETVQSNNNDFPPPPEFLLSNDSKPVETDHSSLLAEIQRGGFKLRKTVIDRDRSTPRIK